MAKILVVDDEPEIGELCACVLSEDGHNVDWTTNGEDAIGRTEKDKFDLVIVDLVMPGMGGLEVVERLRERIPDIGIIVFTGFASVEVAVKAMKGGADDFLTKPVWNDRLGESVAHVLELRNGKSNSGHIDKPKPQLGNAMTNRAVRIINGFTKRESADFFNLGIKDYYKDTMRIDVSHNDETVVILSGEGVLWCKDAPMCTLSSGEAVGEAKIFMANTNNDHLYLEVEPGTELLRIDKEDLVSFFKEKEEKLLMLFAINVVNSQFIKIRYTFDAFSKLYRKMHPIAA